MPPQLKFASAGPGNWAREIIFVIGVHDTERLVNRLWVTLAWLYVCYSQLESARTISYCVHLLGMTEQETLLEYPFRRTAIQWGSVTVWHCQVVLTTLSPAAKLTKQLCLSIHQQDTPINSWPGQCCGAKVGEPYSEQKGGKPCIWSCSSSSSSSSCGNTLD